MVVRTLLCASAALFATAAAQAQTDDAPSTIISFQPHDLTSAESRIALRNRIEREIRAICNTRGQRTLAAFTREKQCERNARANVEMQLGYTMAELAPRSSADLLAESLTTHSPSDR